MLLKMEKKNREGISAKIVDFLFSNDPKKYLLFIVILAAILRFIVISDVGMLADEAVHGVHAINMIHAGVINSQNESPVWFYLTDISYRIFGVNAFGARFLSFFFGIFTVVLLYLVGKKLFSEKVGLIAAFLLAISEYHIRYGVIVMDEAMFFFVLLSFYLFVKVLEDKKRLSYLAVISMGVAMLVKPIALTFVPAMIIYFIYFIFKKAPETKKENIKRIFGAILLIVLFATPILAYNYILYTQTKDSPNGPVVDVLFARFFNVGRQNYAGLQGYDQSFNIGFVLSYGVPWFFKDTLLSLDPIIFVLGVLGIFLIFLKRTKARFFVWFHLATFIFLLGAGTNQIHFSSFVPLLCLSGASFIVFLKERFGKNPETSKKILTGILIFMLLFEIYLLSPYLTSKSAMFKLRSYATSSIGSEDIVIADSRIYRGRIAWAFNDKEYIEAAQAGEFFTRNQNISGIAKPTNIYYIECAVDDCGWGTVASQPDFNASMEDVSSYFENNSVQEKVIYGGGGYGFRDDTKEPYFIIYKTQANVKYNMYAWIDSTHTWFYYPVRWWDWNGQYDKYYPEGNFQTLFNLIGKLFLWISVILAILAPVLVVFELFKTRKDE
jgi:4-amino-4-deoxy-L-arabinose transferase-like glycosyltransferase